MLTHSAKIGLLIALSISVVAAVSVLLYFLLFHDSSSSSSSDPGKSPSQIPGSNCTQFALPAPQFLIETEIRSFFSAASTDGYGRTVEGDLVDAKGNVKEVGLKTATDLAKYPLTYAFGHPYWDTGSIGNLNCVNWKEHLGRFPDKNRLDVSKLNANNILVVSSNQKNGNYIYSPTIIDKSFTAKGIVVRQGGILLIDSAEITIETEFILIESGGLFQAGSTWNDDYRFGGTLKIILTHPNEGFSSMGAVASQYTYKVYAPGVTRTTDTSATNKTLQTPYTGNTDGFNNQFGTKVIAVGFNGNYHLGGQIGLPLPYKGTWSSTDMKDGSSWLSETDLLTYFDGSDHAQNIKAKLLNIATDYPNVWCRCADQEFKVGETTIMIDMSDIVDDAKRSTLSEWTKGKQIVITCSTPQYQTLSDPQGLVPIWIDNDNIVESKANEAANQLLVGRYVGTDAPKDFGVEVHKIESFDTTTGIITLQSPLKFIHDSRHTVISKTIDGKTVQIKVGTCLHVGLLTRNITITSLLNSGGVGCNAWVGDTPTKASNGWNGPGGSVTCDRGYTSGTEIWSACYDPSKESNAPFNQQYCGTDTSLRPSAPSNGHWLFGTSGNTGCNAIFGGHQMFRYGCSIDLDSVELKYMGQPANFGSIARYAVHFHLSGFISRFAEYLPKGNDGYGSLKTGQKFSRSSVVQNCSNWCSFSRWFTIHGTHEVTIRNNVSLVCFGSGMFIEDGTELYNTMEHNLCVYNLIATYDSYYNTAPIYPNVSSDMCMSSIFWYKNNQNRCFRNVGCNSPSPIIGIWCVPQKISKLRGPSAVCIGDSNLLLPSIASAGNALTELSQNLNNYADLGLKTPCWMPSDFYENETMGGSESHCLNFSNDNSFIPYNLYAENVFYQIFGGLSEFPEPIGTGGAGFDGKGGFQGCPGLGYNTATSKAEWVNKPQFLPNNGQNSCTDTASLFQSSYFELTFGGEGNDKHPQGPTDYPYQPISTEDLTTYNNQGLTRSQLQTGNVIPKIFSGFLTYNLGPSIGSLWGGAFWVKQVPAHFLNCAFIETSFRVAKKDESCFSKPSCTAQWGCWHTDHETAVIVPSPPFSSSYAITGCGSDGSSYAFSAIYPVFYNLITNGGLALPNNPTLIGGSRLFIGDQVIFGWSEYNANTQFIAATNNYYFIDLVDTIVNTIPPQMWENRDTKITLCGLYDLDKKQYYKIDGNGRINDTRGTLPIIQSWPSGLGDTLTRKYPYMCSCTTGHCKLFTTAEAEMSTFANKNPQWDGFVINSQTPHFINDAGIALGNTLCNGLGQIPACANNANNSFAGPFCCSNSIGTCG